MESAPSTPQRLSIVQIMARNKKWIIIAFYFIYAYIFIDLVLFAYFTAQGIHRANIYALGVRSGQIAIVLFCVTILPGILRRFGIQSPLGSALMLIRRQLGVTTFALGFLHYSSITLFPMLFAGVPLNTSPPLFQLFGILSLYTMTLLFFTSNDWSVRHLGVWWKRIHRLVYVIAWTLFFHVILQRLSVWSILIGIFAVLETLSLMYFYSRPKVETETT